MADIFLSYARKDYALAAPLAAQLEREGWTVFWDAQLRAGEVFSDVLLRELRIARCVVVLWSRAAVASLFVRDEASRGRDRGLLVPVWIERTDIPLGFGEIHTESLVDWSGSPHDAQLRRVIEAIERKAPRVSSPRELDKAAATDQQPSRRTARTTRGASRRDVAAASDSLGPGNPPTAAVNAAGFQDVLARHTSDPRSRARAVDEYCQAHGDPRFRADAWFLPADPMVGFIEIHAGPFTMGSDKKTDSRADAAEQPAHELTVPGFYMARFPVTVAQFRAYAEDAGVTPGDPDCLRGAGNHPVVDVSWQEALAYGAWLTKKLREWPGTPRALARVLDPKGKGVHAWQVTLASEAEWEKAARGTDGRIYPWGPKADANKANYLDTRIGGTSAVGCFSSGASPFGVDELCGNVWEWTRSSWGKDRSEPTFGYPYRPTDGREVLTAGDDTRRVVRGGSFLDPDWDVRAVCRGGFRPQERLRNLGFRVVVSPFFSEL